MRSHPIMKQSMITLDLIQYTFFDAGDGLRIRKASTHFIGRWSVKSSTEIFLILLIGIHTLRLIEMSNITDDGSKYLEMHHCLKLAENENITSIWIEASSMDITQWLLYWN